MKQGVVGIPRGLWCEDMERHRVLIMDLLGPSLEDLFNFCGRQFNLKTTLMLADQMVRRLESFHGAQHIHRDIKTDNFCMGLRKGMLRVVHLIDFGLSKCYLRSNGKHIPVKNGKSLTGTPRYVSINVHKGIEPSRRDDLESTGYLFLYFLKFDQTPDYDYLKNLFSKAFQEQSMVLDHKYDWVVKLEAKNYKQADLAGLPTLARFKSEERMHAEQIEQMMNDGDLDGVDEEEVERKMAEMEGITSDILGELDKEAGDDHDANLALMYRAVTDRSTRYRTASGVVKDTDSIEKVRGGDDGKKEGGQGCSCTIL